MVEFVDVKMPFLLAEMCLLGEIKSFSYNYGNDTLVYLSDFNKAEEDINVNINIYKAQPKDIERLNEIFPLMSPVMLGFKTPDIKKIEKELEIDEDYLLELNKMVNDLYEIMDRSTPLCDPVTVPVMVTAKGTNPGDPVTVPVTITPTPPDGTHIETDEEGNSRIVVDAANLNGFKTVKVDGKDLLIPSDIEDVAGYLNMLKEARERGEL